MEFWKKNLLVCWFGVFATSTGLSQLAPILPLYIDQLGVHDMASIEQWSGIIYGITFIGMAVFSRFGGKPPISMDENQCCSGRVLGWQLS